MELGSIKQKVFQWSGWLSVITALFLLAIINISLLWGYNMPMGNNIMLWLLAIFIFGIIALFQKRSRPLGVWGLALGVYLGFFIVAMFMLSWAINPFP